MRTLIILCLLAAGCTKSPAIEPPSTPAPLLIGAEWMVEDLNGGGVIDNSHITLNFGEDGRLAGRAGCNSYSASYELEFETLTFGAAMSTRMACAPALMNQESRFFGLLETVERYEFDSTGALILHGSDGGTILARR